MCHQISTLRKSNVAESGHLDTLVQPVVSVGQGLIILWLYSYALSPNKILDYNLRNSESYVLPQCTSNVYKRSFVNWCLFDL